MDDLAQFNKSRWEELAAANVDYSRPALALDADSSRSLVDPHGVMGDVRGKKVLCLASGGGQQSAAFALLGADVTVLDLSETQLERDRLALAHYNLSATLEQGDMRDLTRFADNTFDLVWQAFSINFIHDPILVFREVRRVLKPGGLYHVEWHNPFLAGINSDSWNGQGYILKNQYRDGEIVFDSPYWEFDDLDGTPRKIEGPQEFNHKLSTMINGLIGEGFILRGVWEQAPFGDPTAEPGSWKYFLSIVPLYLGLWAVLPKA